MKPFPDKYTSESKTSKSIATLKVVQGVRQGQKTTALHSEPCRKRVDAAMQTDETSEAMQRYEETVARLNRYIEEQLAQEVESKRRRVSTPALVPSATKPTAVQEDGPKRRKVQPDPSPASSAASNVELASVAAGATPQVALHTPAGGAKEAKSARLKIRECLHQQLE